MKTLKLKHYTQSMLFLALTVVFGCKNSESTENSKDETETDSLQSKDEKVVLVVLSAKNELEMSNKTTIKTGYFLDELAVPAQALIAAGYKIEVATPGGVVPTMDESSNSAAFFQDDKAKLDKSLEFVRTHESLNKPLKLADVANSDLKKYSAVFVPGGRAPMTDLMQSEDLGKILRYAHEQNIITALLCHGPVALIAALDDSAAYKKALISNNKAEIESLGKNWIYSGYNMTIFSNSEEDDALKDSDAKLQFYVADALKLAGGKTTHGKENWKPFVVKDRELITGQNPASDHALAEALVEALTASKK
ncbi:type 1 glutamine amidotransferase domain-containing protein [Flavobacterium terrisoli]|uniref:type 1 glutamine amidotransferase domain-containing protein n=1 Tax=Flavobacterium terrisoli TaxID=3242195 RepID=UPI0025435446|nr:type 1 glutamine amidotransferase domain-containing protein [Flavobacterium buctense]